MTSPSPVMGPDGRWVNLIHTALRITAVLDAKPGAGKEVIHRHLNVALESVLEVFPPEVDPAEDLQGYAVRTLVQSVRQSLERL